MWVCVRLGTCVLAAVLVAPVGVKAWFQFQRVCGRDDAAGRVYVLSVWFDGWGSAKAVRLAGAINARQTKVPNPISQTRQTDRQTDDPDSTLSEATVHTYSLARESVCDGTDG